MKKDLLLTILFPCLNEESTLATSILEAEEQLKEHNLYDRSEILVVDNGSVDQSVKIAKKCGARVVHEKKRGYGYALRKGISRAYGKYIIFADCDNSYKFDNIDSFISLLEEGADFVIGNRFKGKMEKKAMPFSHRYIGTPIISLIGRLIYKVNISDFNCGLRALKRDSFDKIHFKSGGMEFASELIIKAKKNHLIMKEVPINFYKDNRNRKPHLRTIRDGIRHLKVLLRELECQNKRWMLIMAIIIMLLLKIFIINGQIINIKNYAHDDKLFVSAAHSILNNNWLGVYNDRTLSKGVAGILFIALSKKLNISYLVAEQVLYFLACVSVIKMISNFINNNKVLFLIFFVLFMNPISYSDAFSLMYRDGLYTCLFLFLIAFSFQVFFHYKDHMKKLLLYSSLLGFTYSTIFLCREETMSLTPYLICAGIIILSFIIFDKECNKKIQRIVYIVGLPFVILVVMVSIISGINYKYYGRFITNDFTSKDFKDAYGALTRIKQKNYIKRVPLNKESREELYKISPTFAELQYFLEGRGKRYFNLPIEDYQEGFLYWAVREAAYELGYYKDAKKSKEFYVRLANEINTLCDQKLIECTAKRSSLIAPIYPETLDELKIYIPKTFANQIMYKNVLVEIPQKHTNYLFSIISNHKVQYESKDEYKLSIMKFFLKIYKIINPFLTAISVIFYLFIMFFFFKEKHKSKYYKQIILINGVLGLYLLRIGTVAFVASAEYTSAIEKCQYLAPSYPLLSLFIILSIVIFIEQIKDYHYAWFRIFRKV